MKILVDADACPRSVLQICIRLGRKHNIQVWTVASFNHHIESDHPIVVGDGFQEADIKILNLTEPGDVVVTGDWGLAAMVLGRGAKCLSPIGREYWRNVSSRRNFVEEAEERKARGRGHRKRIGDSRSLSKRFFCESKGLVVSFEKEWERRYRRIVSESIFRWVDHE
jgi:uncharacterized protein YaiI (UPF0178 family)